MKVSFFISEKR